MKLEHLGAAKQAAREYQEAKILLEEATTATHYRVHCGSDIAVARTPTEPVNTDQTLYSGELAKSAKAALINYRSGMFKLACDNLRKLGVEPE